MLSRPTEMENSRHDAPGGVHSLVWSLPWPLRWYWDRSWLSSPSPILVTMFDDSERSTMFYNLHSKSTRWYLDDSWRCLKERAKWISRLLHKASEHPDWSRHLICHLIGWRKLQLHQLTGECSQMSHKVQFVFVIVRFAFSSIYNLDDSRRLVRDS